MTTMKTKSVIVAENVTKRFGERTIIRKRLHASHPARGPHRPCRWQRHGQDDAAEAAHRRARARRRIRHPGENARRHRDRPAAQIDVPEKRVRDVLADGSDWIDVRGVKNISRAI
jgi:ATP-binding cassette subfamily F protein uup